MMQDTGAADSIAEFVSRKMGPKRVVFAVVAACAIMTYGGVSLFVVGFSVYPIAVSLFKKANLPHRFIPAALVFGSISFTMTAPGSPEIQNLIPTDYFHTTPTAGGWIGFTMALLIMVLGGLWLGRMVNKAVQEGETFSLPENAEKKEQGAQTEVSAAAETGERSLPFWLTSILPLVAVIVFLNVLSKFWSSTSAALVSLTIGILLTWLLNYKFVKQIWESLASGTQNALVAAANTCAVVGFGSVAAKAPAFQSIVNSFQHMPGYLGLAVGVTLICAITGSASGGLGIALPILAPIYMAKGLDPGAMHRIAALGSGGLDSMPHNGYVVTTIRTICGETHKRSYKPIFMLSVILPTAVMLLAVILYSLFY
ncbi:H+/gluconate symporter-like permease [Pullulanibacillus pueri]|uniref:Permease n=1 Tax=Pullulanibacillus pueri TaxID=1437324 RepID=A0A8J2ZUS2_9BACL|nr:H+/gluconate symporter-like permease [Pullulanibacillus pueri]GGH79853.1 permease [Pullulanibacillus pueri]